MISKIDEKEWKEAFLLRCEICGRLDSFLQTKIHTDNKEKVEEFIKGRELKYNIIIK